MYFIKSIIGYNVGTVDNLADYANAVEYYGEDIDGTIVEKIPEYVLFRNRHDIPCEETIFGESVENPTVVLPMYSQARKVLSKHRNGVVCLYVTGLTPALVEAINAAHDLGIELCLKHYNRETGGYFKQWVR